LENFWLKLIESRKKSLYFKAILNWVAFLIRNKRRLFVTGEAQ
jgi:hypothetical protein